MNVKYSIYIDDQLGNRLYVPNYINLRWYRCVNGLGSFTFTAQMDLIPEYFLKRDNIVEIWRTTEDGRTKLVTDTIWFIRRIVYDLSVKKRTVTVMGYDLNFLLGNPASNTGRIAAYYAGEAETRKTGEADDMIKAIARENFGTSASDFATSTSRSIPFLTIDSDFSFAPSIAKSFSWRNLSRVFQEICQASREAIGGMYLAYDFVCEIPPKNKHSLHWPTIPGSDDDFKIMFKTFVFQRGKDHTRTGGDPVLFGPTYGNMDSVTLTKDYEDEISFVYAGGDGQETARDVETADGFTDFETQPWIWNRREKFLDSIGSEASELQDEANTELRIGKPKIIIEGELLSTPSTQYGKHWEWGDKITVDVLDYSLDAWIEGLSGYDSQEEGETISTSIKAEETL